MRAVLRFRDSRLTEFSGNKDSTFFADYFQREVCDMEAQPFWELVCMTGEPLAYMLYRKLEGAEKELPPIL